MNTMPSVDPCMIHTHPSSALALGKLQGRRTRPELGTPAQICGHAQSITPCSPLDKYLDPCHAPIGHPGRIGEGDRGSIGVFTIIPHIHIQVQLQVVPHEQSLQAGDQEQGEERVL